MMIKVIELVALITLTTWIGLYLLVRRYGGVAEKHAGTIYLCYGVYLFVRGVAKASTEHAFGILLARFAYVPAIIAMVVLCQLACSFIPTTRAIKRVIVSVMVAVSAMVGILAVSTPLISQGIVYGAPDEWPHTENGPLFWVWLIYVSVFIGLSLYLFGRAWLAVGIKRILNSNAAPNPIKQFSGVALIVIASGFLNHVGKAYEDTFSIAASLVYILSTGYLAFLMVTTFDKAFRSPANDKGVALYILLDTLMILVGTCVALLFARMMNNAPLPLSTLLIIDFWVSALAAIFAGTRHRLYANSSHEIRRFRRRGFALEGVQPPLVVVSLSTPSPSPALVPAEALPPASLPLNHRDASARSFPEGSEAQVSQEQNAAEPDCASKAQADEGTGNNEQLYRELRLALRSLHDPARLSAFHSLADDLPGETAWQRGEALQQQLIQAIQRLEPNGDESYANQWQHYQILWRLYCEGQSRLDIMRELSLSERHYQRHLHDALVVFVAQWQNSGKNRIDAEPAIE
jgi:hypothetical protein